MRSKLCGGSYAEEVMRSKDICIEGLRSVGLGKCCLTCNSLFVQVYT